MAFWDYERSRILGSPIELYRFRYGETDAEAYCYTNSEREVVFQGQTYRPVPIKRGRILTSTEGATSPTLDVELSGDAEVCELFRVSAPSAGVGLTIFQGHSRDKDNEFRVIWTGRVTICARESHGNLGKLSCEPVQSQLNRIALRRHFQYMCPHVLYGDQCRASESAATSRQTVAAINGRLVTLSVLLGDHGKYVGGMLRWPGKGGVVTARTVIGVREVEGHTQFGLSAAADDLEVGQQIDAIRGCSHDTAGCIEHNNILNFGGQPFIPTKSPLGINGAFS